MKITNKASTFQSLKLRDFRFLWFSQLSNSLSMWMDQTARSWLIYSLTGSAFDLGMVNALRGAPMFLFGIVAGVLADRYNRKYQLVIAQILNCILNTVLATLILAGHVQVWQIYLTSILSGVISAFQFPAGQVLVNDLVGKDNLMNAISLSAAASNVSRIVGPAVCGILIEVIGIDMSYYVQGALFIISTILTLNIRVPTHTVMRAANLPRASFLAGTKVGMDYIMKHKVIFSLMVLALAPMLLGGPYLSLIPVFAVDVFHGNAGTQGTILMVGGIGAVIGALVIASFGKRQGSIPLLIGVAAGYGLSILWFALSPVLWIALGATFFSSMCMSTYQSQNQTIIQMITPNKIQGRVIGVYMLSNALSPLGSLLAGALVSGLGPQRGVSLMGIACFLVAAGVAIFSRSLWKLNIEAERERAAREDAQIT